MLAAKFLIADGGRRASMKRALTSNRARSLSHFVLASSLSIASLSCGKLPRRTAQANSPTTPVAIVAELPRKHLIDINTASPQELEGLPGIGKGLAARIVAHRDEYGRFRRAEHLMMVRGISARRFHA